MLDLLDDHPLAFFIVAAALLIGVCGFIACTADRMSCNASWSDSGMPHRWSVMGGCQVQTKGAWIPSDNYRALQ